MGMRKGIYHLIMHAVLLSGAIFSILPFFWMIATSLKTPDEVNRSEIQWLPSVPQWSNYPEAMQRASSINVPFDRCFKNSAIVALAVTAGVLVTAVLAAYAFSIKTFKGKSLIFLLFLSSMMIPFEVTLIPNFITIQNSGGTIPWPH